MRLKFDRENPDMYKCCFCCHVRTGTILLGIFHLVVHILVLSLFAVICLHPELARNFQAPEVQVDVENNYSFESYRWFKQREWTSEDKFVGLLVTVGSFLLTVLLIYGTAKARPGYMMPFFCLQVFDFCVTCLTIVGYFSYMPDLKGWIQAQQNLPYKEELLSMDGDWLMLIAVVGFVLVLSLKAYFIGVVWACYRFLTNYQRTVGTVRRYTDTDPETDDSEMLLPPKYEDVLRMSAGEPQPPAYSPN